MEPLATADSPNSVRAIRIPADSSNLHFVTLNTARTEHDDSPDTLVMDTIDHWGWDGWKQEQCVEMSHIDMRAVPKGAISLYYQLYTSHVGNLPVNMHISTASKRWYGDAFFVKVVYDPDDFHDRIGYEDAPEYVLHDPVLRNHLKAFKRSFQDQEPQPHRASGVKISTQKWLVVDKKAERISQSGVICVAMMKKRAIDYS
ncbi:hypothetical protein ACLMJK_004231 [Lecanora helva]